MSDNLVVAVEEHVTTFRRVMSWQRDSKTFKRPDFWSSLLPEFDAAVSGDQFLLHAQWEKNQGGRFANVLTPYKGLILPVVYCDCDNFSWSAVDKVITEELPIPAKDLACRLVSAPNMEGSSAYINHMIGTVRIDGVLYGIDNASAHPFYKLTSGPFYNFVEFMTMDDPGNWYPQQEAAVI